MGDLLLNAVALEFVLLLKELIYNLMVPNRSKLETQSTYVLPGRKRSHATCWEFFSSFSWGLFAFAWVICYVKWQRVLPSYRWDVADMCDTYLESQLVV